MVDAALYSKELSQEYAQMRKHYQEEQRQLVSLEEARKRKKNMNS